MEDTIIVNIGRQLGSGGRQIGERIARRLNLRFYDRELLALAAEQSGLCTELFEKADEKESKGRLATLLGYLRGPFAGDDGGMTNVLSNDALFKIQSDAIRRAAAGGSCVFVGRCADYPRPAKPTASPACVRGTGGRRSRPGRRWRASTRAEPPITIITATAPGARHRATTCASTRRCWGSKARPTSSWNTSHAN